MAKRFTCADGHHWDLDEPVESTVLLPQRCPVCGASARTHGEDPRLMDTLEETLNLGGRRSSVAPGSPHIPGYEILDTLGRGGMGVVYRARQLALQRDVALKVILAGRQATTEQLLRFRIEAESLACLHHPHIVQVYEVGEHDGQPFLVMEFIDGLPLDRSLQSHPMAPRPAAELMETLSRAMHSAHLQGIVHRDLKPANILLSSTGIPKITDFGLAKRLSDEVAQTQTGMCLGTPRYMAPEQTVGNARRVGPPADVYALGGILYELLTGRPPFLADSVYEMLEQVRDLSPPPLRRLQQHVPRDLETICLKCLSKDAEQRYATAEALADDLRRWLDGMPIRARPVGGVERLVKWARRRPVIAALSGLVVLLVLSGAGGGVWYQARLRTALDAAERRFELASRAVDEMLDGIGDERLVIEPRMEQQRRALLEAALAFSQALAEEKPTDQATRRQLGFSYRRLGDILRLLGQYDDSEAAYQKSIQILQELAASANDPEILQQLATAHNFAGELFRIAGRPQDARQAYMTALGLQRELVAHSNAVEFRIDQARTHYNIGILAKNANELDEAYRELSGSIHILSNLNGKQNDSHEARQHLARAHLNLGSVLRMRNELPKAQQAYLAALEILQQLSRDYPYVSDYEFETALGFNNLGNLLAHTKDLDAAAEQHQRACGILERLARDYPGIPIYRQELANASNGLGAVEAQRKRYQEARDAWQAAATALEYLLANGAASPGIHGDLGMCFGNLGTLCLISGEAESAGSYWRRGLEMLQPALLAQPSHPSYRAAAQRQCRMLSAALIRQGNIEEAQQIADSLPKQFSMGEVGVLLQAAFLDSALAEIQKLDDANGDQRLKWKQQFADAARKTLSLAQQYPDAAESLARDAAYQTLRSIDKAP